jgi:F-type H+-transporting ATPase subunit a
MIIVMVLLIAIGAWVARRATLVPTRGQGAVEMIVEFLLGLVEGAAGKRLGRSIFPVIGGLFIFILFANYVELLPGLGSVYLVHHVGTETERLPLIRPPTSDLNMTLAMALLSFVMFQYLGIKAHGFRGRIKHLATPVFVFPIEVISETARIISLSFRLFGNIFAGDVLLTIMYSIAAAIKVTLIGFLIPVVFLYLEVLFGFIQALVFAILTLIYISLAAAEVHDDHVEESFEQESGVRAHRKVEASASGD